MQLIQGGAPDSPVALYHSRFEAGEHLLFFHRDRRKAELVDPIVVAMSDGGVELGYPWAYLQGRELRRLEPGRISLLDPCQDVLEHDVLLVDDGAAAPETVAAVAGWLRKGRPHRLVVAVAAADHRLEELCTDADFVLVGRHVTHLQPGTNVFVEPPTPPETAEAWMYDANEDRGFPSQLRRPRNLARRGLPWTVDEEAQLLEGFDLGRSARELGDALGRTASAVESRLERYGLIEHDTFKSHGRFLTHLDEGRVLARAWTPRNQVRVLRHLLRRSTLEEATARVRALEAGLRPDPGSSTASFTPCPQERLAAVDAAMDGGARRTLQAFLRAHPELVEVTP